jgi:protoporphyrinogen oxidase
VVWPVPEGVAGPWDGIFITPVTGDSAFGLFTNYGYLAKHIDPQAGGYLSTMANARKSLDLVGANDDEVIELFARDLRRIFPGFERIVDTSQAIIANWAPTGLPRFAPGSLSVKATVREPFGRVHFCGDYTAEPGLAGANNSGMYTGRGLQELLG